MNKQAIAKNNAVNESNQSFLFLLSVKDIDLHIDPVLFLNRLIEFAEKQPNQLNLVPNLEIDVMWAAAEVDRHRFSSASATLRALYAKNASDTMVRRVGKALGLKGIEQLRHANEVKHIAPNKLANAPTPVVDQYITPYYSLTSLALRANLSAF